MADVFPKIAPAVLNTDENAKTGSLVTGVVSALVTDTQTLVRLEDGDTRHADQAAGCLLQPAIGDTVLVYDDPDSAYILSVLKRGEAQPATLAVPGAGHVALKAEKQLEFSAPDMKMTARRLSLITETLTKTGKQLFQTFTKTLETTVDKFVSARTINTTANTRSSAVKETDTLQAGVLVQNIDSVATQNSDISMVTAKEDVRLDAKRVSVG